MRPSLRRLPDSVLMLVGLGSLALALLCTTQPWQTSRRLDPAGLAWESQVSGAALSPGATALFPVAAAAVLAAQLLGRVSRSLVILLSVAASASATVLLVFAAPTPISGWWVVALVLSALATTSLGLLLDPREPAPRRAREPQLNAHERQRRAQAATWAALSGGDDPTASPTAGAGPTTGRMSSERPTRP